VRLWQVFAALALLAVVGAGGFRQGVASTEAKHARLELKQKQAADRLNAERRQIALERGALARKLEEEAHAAPVVVERCLGPGRLQRLNRLR
jgi:hypothetical protein